MLERTAGRAERFSFARVTSSNDEPAPQADTLDVALLDMNAGFPNVGHDAIAGIVRETALAQDAALERAGLRVRVISYAVRDRRAIPEHAARFVLYLGSGGPGHLDPRENSSARGAEEIIEGIEWEAPLWRLFEAVVADPDATLYGVCHTFGLLCRWSQMAAPELRSGGPASGVGTNVLTAAALAHPWFAPLGAELGATIPVLDSRYYDLVPTGSVRAGAVPIAHDAGALTMLELARGAGGVPRVFAVNSHPEIRGAAEVEGILRRMLAEGTLDRETFEKRSALLPVLRDDRGAERLRVAGVVFGDLVRRRLERAIAEH